jgi:hypothetical protein
MTDATVLRKSNCRGCGRPVIWVKLKDSGAKVPLDPSAPVYAYAPDMFGELVASRTEGYVSHFATCSKANDFSASRPAVRRV